MKLSKLSLFILGTFLTSQSQANANSSNSRAIEEIIVTAQKREEAVQDVPISMSVMNDDFITEQGINDLATAMLYVPSVKVTAAGFFAAPNARGFTFNNNNKAFEPPLGLAIDGLPYTRIPYFLAATFDLQRIEVLRGPQGTTFGKNTTAGLIHMLTKNPTDELSGALNIQGGEYNRRRYEGVISGPIIKDFLNIRIAGFSDVRDGYIKNTTHDARPGAQKDFLGHDRDGFRIKAEFTDLAGSNLRLSYEEVNLVDRGTGAEIIRAKPEVQEYMRQFDPNTDFTADNNTASMDYPDGRSVTIKTFNSQWDMDFSNWGLVVVGGYSQLSNSLTADIDFSPAPASYALGGDTSPTTTLEARLISPTLDGLFGLTEIGGLSLGSSDFIMGGFYQNREINDSTMRFVFDVPVYLGMIAAASPNTSGLAPLIGLYPTFTEGTILEDATQNFEQRAETAAFFGEAKWNFHQDFTAQLGFRVSDEEKSAAWQQVYNNPQPSVLLPENGLEEFEAERSMKDSQFQYKVSLNWHPSDDISIFAHQAKAVKGGGFNAFSFRGVDDELQYSPEYTTEYAINAKTFWLDKTLVLNLGIYRMEVEDFQVLIRDAERANLGVGVSRVTNAAEARAQGFEGDFQWNPLAWLTLIGTIGYNETEYLNFTRNECPADRPMPGGCDATGKSFPFTPEWNNTLTTIFRTPIGSSGLEFTASATIENYSEQFLDVDLDERKIQEGFSRYKASIGLSHPIQGWSIKVVGENLTDQRSGVRQGDLFEGVFVESVEIPRMIYGQLAWSF
ncbi:TonB-dependent receptor [Spongiibacter sp. KMU-158]|uniref:TonB-dependent receptor n=1 Tax=Spongiibacter pelagi TaxID=2760804 RepID=A0A927GXJ1_9GAMM|nr:TonB-dependent receptor [Spongiibacter pelagi]MBD2860223.1 TonB-dependent receptor [Spongiibacter pelagi]